MCWSWALAWHSREPGLACQPGLVSRPTQATYWNMVSKKNRWGGDGWWFNRKYLVKETPVTASHSKAWFVLFIWSRILLWSLKLRAILLPQPTKCWNYRYELSHKPSSPTSPPKQTDWVLLSKLSFYFLTVLCAFFFFFATRRLVLYERLSFSLTSPACVFSSVPALDIKPLSLDKVQGTAGLSLQGLFI